MIITTTGNILEATTQAVVNPVNCEGVMGKGLALQFKNAFPGNYNLYRLACKSGLVTVGNVFWTHNDNYEIANFPTKDAWRNPSKLEYIDNGLETLYNDCIELGIDSIALPKLGCGLGGLEWEDVVPLITKYFLRSDVTAYVYV